MDSEHCKINVSFTDRGRSRQLAVFGTLLALLAVAGCTVPVEDGEDVSQQTKAIENGELLPSELNGGTVLIQMLATNGGVVRCSGQVISRDSVLTAAHCFEEAGYYDSNWRRAVSVPVLVQHQNPNGSWENLTNIWETGTAMVPLEYISYLRAGDSKRFSYDLAVLRRSQAFWNAEPSDVSALARYIQHKPNYLYAYGHGFKSQAGALDLNLSRGLLDNLTWPSKPNEKYLGSIRKDYGPNDNARVSSGDSGGPWKLPIVSGPGMLSGLLFGVTSASDPLAACAIQYSLATRTAFIDSWIENQVTSGQGVCGHYTHVIHPWRGSSSTLSVNTLVCW